MEIWNEFKEKIGIENFNVGLKINKGDIPNELLKIFKDADGQKSDYKPVFLEFRNDILGFNIILYKFISYNELLELKEEMIYYTKEKDLFPFALLVNRQVGDEGAIVFAFSSFDEKIYKVQFYRWDRFVHHTEFKKEVFANNLNEFLENQVLWNSLRDFQLPGSLY